MRIMAQYHLVLSCRPAVEGPYRVLCRGHPTTHAPVQAMLIDNCIQSCIRLHDAALQSRPWLLMASWEK